MKYKKIENASLFKRSLAALLDFLIALFVGYGISIPIQEGLKSNEKIDNYIETYYKEAEDSSILKLNDDNNELNVYTFSSYKDYQDKFVFFYENYLPSKSDFEYIHDNYWFNVHVLGLDDVLGKYSNADLSEIPSFIKENGKLLFEYKNNDYNVLALPIAMNQNESSVLNEIDLLKLRKYFHLTVNDEESDKTKCVYYYAINEFSTLDVVSNSYSKYRLYSYSLPVFGSMIVSFAIFYVVLPLLLKRGKTLCKQFFKLSVLNQDGYESGKAQIGLRMIPLLSITLIMFLFFGLSLASIGLLTIILLVTYILMIFSKNQQTIHDKLFLTIVIDDKNSVWFKDKEEEEEFTKNNI